MNTLSLVAKVLPTALDAVMPAQADGLSEKARLSGESGERDSAKERDEAKAWTDIFSGVVDNMQFAQAPASASESHNHGRSDPPRVGHLLHADDVGIQHVSNGTGHKYGHSITADPAVQPAIPRSDDTVPPTPAQIVSLPQPPGSAFAASPAQTLLMDVLEQGRLSGEIQSFNLQAFAALSGVAGDPVDSGLGGGSGEPSGGNTGDGATAYTADTSSLMAGTELGMLGGLGFGSTLSSLETRGADVTGTAGGLVDLSWVQDIAKQMDMARLKDESSLRLDVMLAGDQRLALQAQLQDGVLRLTFDANASLINVLQADQLEALKAAMMENAPDIREVRFEQSDELPQHQQSNPGQSGRGEGRRDRDSGAEGLPTQVTGTENKPGSGSADGMGKPVGGLAMVSPDADLRVSRGRVSLRA
jgi:hypothetical protein